MWSRVHLNTGPVVMAQQANVVLHMTAGHELPLRSVGVALDGLCAGIENSNKVQGSWSTWHNLLPQLELLPPPTRARVYALPDPTAVGVMD